MVSLLTMGILYLILMFNVDNASIFSQTRIECLAPAGVLIQNPAVDQSYDQFVVITTTYSNGLTYQTLKLVGLAER